MKNIANMRTLAILERLYSIYIPKTDNNSLREEDNLLYWKNVLFAMFATLVVTLGGPGFLYGGILFIREGALTQGIIEIISYFVMTIILTNSKVPVLIKKYVVLVTFYSIGIMIIIFTGPKGAGMAIVLFSLLFSGLIFSSYQVKVFYIGNLSCFALFSYCLMAGLLDSYPVFEYKVTWWINVITVQFTSLILLILAHIILDALERQNFELSKSRYTIVNSQAKYRTLLTHLTDIVTIVSCDGFVQYYSPNSETHFDSEEFNQKPLPFITLFEEEDQIQIANGIQKSLNNKESTFTIKAKAINKRYYEVNIRNMLDNVHINGLLISLYDITLLVQREEEIVFLYERDSLTGLRNRLKLNHHLSRFSHPDYYPCSIIYGDVNGLKLINDALGHNIGDSMLKSISSILENCCTTDDLIFRVGGDEFLMLLPKTTEQQCQMLIAKIHSACETFNVTHELAQHKLAQHEQSISPDQMENTDSISSEIRLSPFNLSISLGYSILEDTQISMESVMRHAEDSMYRHKLSEDSLYHKGMINAMINVLNDMNPNESEHGERLAHLAKNFAKHLNLSDSLIEECNLVAKLHDIGKIGIESNILKKSSILTKDDWDQLRRHPEIGYRIAINSSELSHIADAIFTHHERWDGRGYPQCLSGEDIPLIARIIAIVESYDAMTHERPYRAKRSHQEAIEELKQLRGSQFDPNLVDEFVKLINQNPDLLAFKTGELG